MTLPVAVAHVGCVIKPIIGAEIVPIFKVTVSIIFAMQELGFVAVKVIVIGPVAPEAIVYVEFTDVGFENVPLGADHATDCCPCAVPISEIVEPEQAVIGVVPASTEKTGTGATQPLFT